MRITKKRLSYFLILILALVVLSVVPLRFGILKWAYIKAISAALHQELSARSIEAYPLRKVVLYDMDISVGRKTGLGIRRAQLTYNPLHLLSLKLPIKLKGEGLVVYNKLGKVEYMAFSEVDASVVFKSGEFDIDNVVCRGDDAIAEGRGTMKRKEMNMAFSVSLKRSMPGMGKLFKFVGVDETLPSWDFTVLATGNPKNPSFDISSDFLKLKFERK